MDINQQLPGWNKNISYWLEQLDEEEDSGSKLETDLPVIPQPETPKEPMEFLSRSWSLSATEIMKAISQKQTHIHHHHQHSHSVLSVAGLAAATALAASKHRDPSSKMSTALASATEILASYCIELAESSVVDHERVANVVRSGVGIRTASDLLSLTVIDQL